mgnify:CR=1 FL=1
MEQLDSFPVQTLLPRLSHTAILPLRSGCHDARSGDSVRTTSPLLALQQGENAEQALKAMAHRLTNKLIHAPTQALRQAVRQRLGLPVAVGIAPTKVLAKMAESISSAAELSPHAPRIVTVKIPADRIGDVALAAAIRPHHADQLPGQHEVGGFSERLETGKLDRGETHGSGGGQKEEEGWGAKSGARRTFRAGTRRPQQGRNDTAPPDDHGPLAACPDARARVRQKHLEKTGPTAYPATISRYEY